MPRLFEARALFDIGFDFFHFLPTYMLSLLRKFYLQICNEIEERGKELEEKDEKSNSEQYLMAQAWRKFKSAMINN